MNNFIGLIATQVLSFTGIAINGYLLALYWSWFITPIFHIKQLAFIEATALMLFLKGFLWTQKKYTDLKGKKVDTTDIVKDFFFTLLVEAFVLLELYIIKCFMS